MSIYHRKSGRYQVVIDLESSVTGARRRKAVGVYRTRREAKSAERQAIEARDRGIDLSPKTVTVAEAIDRYIERCTTKRLAAKTIERYDELAKCHIAPVIGGVPLARLRPAQVSSVYAEGNREGLSAKTVRHVHSFLHAVLDWAVEQTLCIRNVADVAKRDLPAAQPSPAHALTGDEVRRLLDAAMATPWHALFTLAVCTGARRAELCALRWSDVDFDRGTITIARSIVRTKAGLLVKGTKTGRVRTVPLNGLAISALRAQRARQNERRLRKGTHYENQDLVFANALGEPWNPDSTSNAFRRLARDLKLSTRRLHDVRHSAATWLLQSGIDVRTVAAVLGHSSPVTTLNTYAHVLPGAEARAVEAIAERLATAEKGAS